MAWCRQANVDPDLCYHIVSLNHNELIILLGFFGFAFSYIFVFPISSSVLIIASCSVRLIFDDLEWPMFLSIYLFQFDKC